MEHQSNQPDFLVNSVSRLTKQLQREGALLQLLAGAIKKPPTAPHLWPEREVPEAVVLTVPIMLYSLTMSAHTVAKLAAFPWYHTRDSYAVVRALVELAVNISYIVARGTEAAELALRHTKQKAYRDLSRESEIGGDLLRIYYSPTPDPATIVGLSDALAEFSTKKGEEKMHWVDDSIDRRIAVAGGTDDGVLSGLHLARFIVYRHASEVLHGTHFGVHYCLGLTTPGHEMNANSMKYQGEQQVMLLLASNMAIDAVVRSLHVAYSCQEVEKFRTELFEGTLSTLAHFASNGTVPLPDD